VLTVMDFPSQSNDFNLTEHLREAFLAGQEVLWNIAASCWDDTGCQV